MQDNILIPFLIMMAFIGFISIIAYLMIRDFDRCVDKEGHKWKFDHNSKGNTGDLGLGIKGFWNTNYYKCEKCRKEKTEEIYD